MHAYCKNKTKGEKCRRYVAKHAFVALHEPRIMALMKRSIFFFLSFFFLVYPTAYSLTWSMRGAVGKAFWEFCSIGALSSSWSDCLFIQGLLEKVYFFEYVPTTYQTVFFYSTTSVLFRLSTFFSHRTDRSTWGSTPTRKWATPFCFSTFDSC